MLNDLFPWLDDLGRYGLMALLVAGLVAVLLGAVWFLRFWLTGR